MINSHTPSVVAGTPSVTKTPLSQRWAATAALEEVLARLDSSTGGLSSTEAAARLQRYGPNALRTHRVNALAVLGRQLRSVVLGLLAATAVVSYFLGDTTQAIIIGVILAASIGLGFVNEYRAERATAALHSRVHHSAVVRRDGHFIKVDVTDLVPGDVIRLALGQTVPADVRLIEVTELECNEGILSGESSASEKSLQPVNPDAALADSVDLAFMGTIVSAGEGVGVVYASGVDAQFGRIAAGLGERQPETDFQAGLRRFSYLLLWVAMTLTVLILVTNLLLGRPVIDSVLFALAIAVGITPQLLPAVVSTSLATGSRRLGKLKVLVKRLVCIEDLGDIDVLVTDKTGTLTEGRITLVDAVDPAGAHADTVLRAGLLAAGADSDSVVSANAMDAALSRCTDAERLMTGTVHRIATLPFDHTRRAMSCVLDDDGRRVLLVKGAPEQVLAKCVAVPDAAQQTLSALFADGRRVVAVASRAAPGLTTIDTGDEAGLRLDGFLVFSDEPKAAARDSLAQLAALGIEVKVATGDNPQVAEKVCADLGLASKGTITGAEMETLDDNAFDDAAQNNTIFARISPEQKARLVVSLRRTGRSVGFLGDGVKRCAGATRCRRRDLGRHRHRRRQGRRRRGVAGKGPRCARLRCRRGPAHFRQHHQVRADGHIKQFRQHVQRGRGVGRALVPADAAQPDPAQQPALRQLPAVDPHRQRRRRAVARALALEHRIHPPVHADIRSDQLAVRLHDLRADAGCAARRAGRVPHRMVRGIPCHPNPHHFRDPDPARALHPQPARPGHHSGHLRRRRRRHRDHRLPDRAQPWFHHPAVAVLHRTGVAHRRISDPRRDNEEGVLRRPDPPARHTSTHPRTRTSHPPPRRAFQPQRLKAPAL